LSTQSSVICCVPCLRSTLSTLVRITHNVQRQLARCHSRVEYAKERGCNSVYTITSSVVRYLRYLDKYREYRRFDTSIKEVSIYHDISWCHNTAKYRDMTIKASIPRNHSIVDNCTMHDSNEKKHVTLKPVL